MVDSLEMFAKILLSVNDFICCEILLQFCVLIKVCHLALTGDRIVDKDFHLVFQ